MAAFEVAKNRAGTVIGHHEVDSSADSIVQFGDTSGDARLSTAYDHLYCVVSARTNRGAGYDTLKMFLNNDTTSGNYSFLTSYISAATPRTGQSSGYCMITDITGNTSQASNFGFANIWIPCHAENSAHGSTDFQPVLAQGGRAESGAHYLGFAASLYKQTGAITQVHFTGNGGNFLEHSSFTLYGVTNA